MNTSTTYQINRDGQVRWTGTDLRTVALQWTTAKRWAKESASKVENGVVVLEFTPEGGEAVPVDKALVEALTESMDELAELVEMDDTVSKEIVVNCGGNITAVTVEPKVVSTNRPGHLKAINEVFTTGLHTVEEITAKLKSEYNLEPAAATLRTQVSKLRRQAGLTRTKSGSGNIERICQVFSDGAFTYKDVATQLVDSGIAEATIRTQVSKLRKAAGFSAARIAA